MTTPPSESDLIREYLRDRAIGCPQCHYNLRGACGETCPECGMRLELQLGSFETRLGPWLVGLLAVALPLGFSGVLTLMGLFGVWQSLWWRAEDSVLLGILTAATAAQGVWLIAIVRRRCKLLQLPRSQQWGRAGGTVCAAFLLQVALLFLFGSFGPN